MKMSNTRKGKGVVWKETTKGPFGEDRTISGYTIDNLDTKNFKDAVSNYEKLFILLREHLKNSDTAMAEAEHLQFCQTMADAVRSKGLLK
jgi:hypothetical protein